VAGNSGKKPDASKAFLIKNCEFIDIKLYGSMNQKKANV
jgi:hypothetical protein